MTKPRYCIEPDALRHLQRDGQGWGHDLQCGSAEALAVQRAARPGLLRRIARRLRGEG